MSLCLQGETRLLCCVCISFNEGIRTFHVLVMQRQQKNVSKSVLRKQNWLFCLLNLLLFWPHCMYTVMVVVAKASQSY